MSRQGVWTSRVVHVLSVGTVVAVLWLFATTALAMETDGRRPLTEEEGARVAQAALAFAEVEFSVAGTVYQGVPYMWGGRTTIDQFTAAVANVTAVAGVTEADVAAGDEEAVPATAPAVSPEEAYAAAVSGLGVDASGLAVNALRALGSNVRFAATPGPEPTWWADATSALLYDYNVIHIEPTEARAGDLVFFGSTSGDKVSVSGVGIVTGRAGTRVDFVVASARQGKVIHTFARTDGDYWQGNIIGVGRFLVRE